MTKNITLRPEQVPSGDQMVFLLAGGRGSGKTQAGASWVTTDPDHTIILMSNSDAIRVTAIEGESGVYTTTAEKFEAAGRGKYGRVYKFESGAFVFAGTHRTPDYPLSDAVEWGIDIERVWIDEAQDFKLDEWFLLTEALPDADYFLTFTPTAQPNEFLDYLYRRVRAIPQTYKLETTSIFDNIQALAPSFVENIVARYGNTESAKSQLHGLYTS